jgi:hypothetical protein
MTKISNAPELSAEKLVIGYSLEALQFAKSHNAMILINGATTPHSVADRERENEWYRLTFDLGMRGLSPIPSSVEGIRIADSVANVTTEFYRLIKIHFQELYIFDMELVEGLAIQEKVEEYIVYDLFNIKRGAKQTVDKLENETSFVRELVFYTSHRHDGTHAFKDCYAKSYITADDLEKFENSETAARLAATRLIRERGLKADKRIIKNKVSYLNVVLEHNRREFHKHKKDFIIGNDLASNIFCCNVSKEWT